MDINPVSIQDETGRIQTYQGVQQDTALLDRIGADCAPEGFDIIIDDCSHIGVLSRVSFWHLFDNHLKSGGVYVIEDWGTGYWDHWVDGVRYKSPKKTFNSLAYRITRGFSRLQQFPPLTRVPFLTGLLRWGKSAIVRSENHSHNYGMVGFVKELVDELGAEDINTGSGGPARKSKFRGMNVYTSHLFIIKA